MSKENNQGSKITGRSPVDEKTVLLHKINENQKKIVKSIIDILDTAKLHILYPGHFDYIYNYKKEPEKLKVMYFGRRPFELEVNFFNEMIMLKSIYPFRVISSCVPLVAMYSLEFNKYLIEIFNLHVDPSSGEMSLEYEYPINNKDFDVERFFKFFDLIVEESRKNYQRLQRICSGKVSRDLYPFYKSMLEWSLNELNGYEDIFDDFSYGFSKSEYDDDESGDVSGYVNELAIFGQPYLPELAKFSFVNDIINSKDKDMLEMLKEKYDDECFDFSAMEDESDISE